jgi:hypothetical protein
VRVRFLLSASIRSFDKEVEMKKVIALLAIVVVAGLAVLGGTFSDGDDVGAGLIVATFSDGD